MAFATHKWGYRARRRVKGEIPTRDDINTAMKDFLEQGGKIQKINTLDTLTASTEAFPELSGDYAHILEEDNNQIEEFY